MFPKRVCIFHSSNCFFILISKICILCFVFQIIETEHMMEHIVNGLSDPVTKVQLSAVRCMHSLSRSVQQLRTSLHDHTVWKPLMQV